MSFEVAIQTLTVSLLPVDHPGHRHYSLTVERRHVDRWVVSHLGQYLDAAGEWSLGTDIGTGWRDSHWHTYEAAVRLAGEHCRLITVNGRSAEEAAALAREDTDV